MDIWHADEEATVELHGPAHRGTETGSLLKTLAPLAEAACLSMPAHVLMASGGDIRLQVDPETGLNGYGCSHRPRPWAISFASSTASSVSERGYVAAEAALLRARRMALGERDSRVAIKACFGEVRQMLAQLLGLDIGTRIVLSASGTDAELLALALTHIGGDQHAPICNLLVGAEETGRGVPLAARGCHFAIDTALGRKVTPGTLIDGFRPDTRFVTIRLRSNGGNIKPIELIEAEIRDAVQDAIARGERVLLHAVDVSKTGVLAPRLALLHELRRTHGSKFDLVIDACQTRLSPASIARYVALDAVVLITGSKFFTGPPFSGAALIPASIARRLADREIPTGLGDYFAQDNFSSNCRAARKLPRGNIGLALRWHAALAEMQAFFDVPVNQRHAIIERFGEAVRAAISAHPRLELIPAAPLFRHGAEEAWERSASIFTFVVLAGPNSKQRWLGLEETQALHRWLNADLSEILPHERYLASKVCHIGQSIPLSNLAGAEPSAALRISAGARLVSGEFAHSPLSNSEGLQKELRDIFFVFEKLDLILRNWHLIKNEDPKPRYDTAAYPGSFVMCARATKSHVS